VTGHGCGVEKPDPGITFDKPYKAAVGVTKAFNEVVARIIDTPSLWDGDKVSCRASMRAEQRYNGLQI
jgi:hypothetical protein